MHYILDLYTSLSTSAAQALASHAHAAGSNGPLAPLESKRSLPDYVIHPPPLGLLDWCLGWRHGQDCSAATLGDLLTQIKIELRQREQQQAEAPTPATWHRELFLHPADWIHLVTAALVGLTALLALVVFFLALHERREDERERKRAVHAINFDAL